MPFALKVSCEDANCYWRVSRKESSAFRNFLVISGITGYEQHMVSDEALMLDFQRGSREALEELFARYRQPLYGFFRRRLESRNRAEDLVQETFLAVIRGSSRYEPRALVRTYLYAIALKPVAVARRKMSHDPAPEQLDTVRGDVENTLWIRQALERLDPSEREILMLRES